MALTIIRTILVETTQIKVVSNYALVSETLHFEGGPNQSQANAIGAGTVSRFIHGMDKRSMVVNFAAKASGENKLFKWAPLTS